MIAAPEKYPIFHAFNSSFERGMQSCRACLGITDGTSYCDGGL
ncbi:MAG: hypothetical protein A4E63_00831 [Syntrophorhabdus sp. PtaU1.Bin050]|nr:MAG: hypothetical protein A4E63_00831 [Syntrophorhabdus sp. PtaU1.Bin050]